MTHCDVCVACVTQLQAAKAHIARQTEEKEQMQLAAALAAQQLLERSTQLEECEGQRNQANESLALVGAKMDELEERVQQQEKTIAKTRAMCAICHASCNAARDV